MLEGTRRYWQLGFYASHLRAPGRWGSRDDVALRDIVLVQCAGNVERITRTIEELMTGYVSGEQLHERWLQLCWWYACGKPRRARSLPGSARRELWAAIQLNASSVARGRS